MKWQWTLLSSALFVSFASAQGTPEKLSSPKDSNPISQGSPDTTLNSGNPILFPPESAPETPSGRLNGNHNFDNFISFLSNPLRNVDPRAVTELYPLFGSAYIDATPALPSGNFQIYGIGLTVALSERLAVGLNNGGYAVADLNKGGNGFFQDRFGHAFNRLDFSGQREGWIDIGGFAQYTIIEDVPGQLLLTAGLYIETPTGSKAVFQGNGPANMAPYVTFGKEFGNYHILGTTGYQFPLGGGSSTSHVFFSNVHFDRKCFGWLYPLVEFNYNLSATSHDVSLPTRVGIFNLGNFDSEGDTLTMTVGANAVIVKSKLEFGAGYTTSIASQSNFNVNALLVKMVLRNSAAVTRLPLLRKSVLAAKCVRNGLKPALRTLTLTPDTALEGLFLFPKRVTSREDPRKGFLTMPYRKWKPVLAVACVVAGLAGLLSGPSAAQEMAPLPTACPDPGRALQGPVVAEAQALPKLPPAQPEATDKPLAINLATALRLAGARPLIIASAEASVQVAAEQLAKARVEWLPAFNVGAGYYRHDGATQGQSGNFYINSKDQFLAGGGLTARVATTDALFAPLAARQILRSRQLDVQTARNDALLAAAEAYFNVQQARGRLAAAQDVVDKNRALRKAVDLERLQQARPTDLHRALAQLANFEDSIASTREQWRLASVDLTQVLRLDPAATVVPLEPPSMLVTLISPKETVDALIPIGLTNRPELASQQALVQAALARIRQERMRPLMPSLILEGGPGSVGPGGYLMGGIFASGAAGAGNPSVGRDDVSVGLVWQMQNLGFGNRALVRERRAERQQLLVDLFRLQDLVAADIARAYAQVESGKVRVSTAERGVKEARLAYEGSLANLDELDKVGDVRIQVHRAFEVIDALKALSQAYDNYLVGVNDFNRAQFRLYRALGYPAGILACERSSGPILPVDTTRPPQMAPVCAPDPCPGHTCVKTSPSGPKSSSR